MVWTLECLESLAAEMQMQLRLLARPRERAEGHQEGGLQRLLTTHGASKIAKGLASHPLCIYYSSLTTNQPVTCGRLFGDFKRILVAQRRPIFATIFAGLEHSTFCL